MAIQIPVGVVLIWDGLNSAIPAGWKRTTTLDGLYPKNYGAQAPGAIGGALTHIHNATANHSHTMNPHSHDVTLADVSQFVSDTDGAGTEGTPGHHSHGGTVAGLSGGDLSSVPATYDAVSNDPPFTTVIYIEPDTVDADLAAGICTFFKDPTLPTGWVFCDGANSTLDLRNKFLKGAATGLDAGTPGGSTTNVHPLTHTHVESAHSHSAFVTGVSASGGFHRGRSGDNRVASGHGHTVNLDPLTAGSISNINLTTGEVVEPAHTKLAVIKNNTGGISQPRFLIGLWFGAAGSVPAGWSICDGTNGTPNLTDKYVKIMNTTADLLATGGSNTHTHAAQDHFHTGGNHSHPTGGVAVENHFNVSHIQGVGGSDNLENNSANFHPISSVSSTTVSWANSTTAADSASNEPPYLVGIYVMFTGTPANDQRSAKVTGQVASNAQRSAKLFAVIPTGEARAKVSGKESANTERGARISGKIKWITEEKTLEDPFSG
jgi:hypothetical protein